MVIYKVALLFRKALKLKNGEFLFVCFFRMYYLSNFCIENISTLQCETNVKNNLLAGSKRKGVEIVIQSATRI